MCMACLTMGARPFFRCCLCLVALSHTVQPRWGVPIVQTLLVVEFFCSFAAKACHLYDCLALSWRHVPFRCLWLGAVRALTCLQLHACFSNYWVASTELKGLAWRALQVPVLPGDAVCAVHLCGLRGSGAICR